MSGSAFLAQSQAPRRGNPVRAPGRTAGGGLVAELVAGVGVGLGVGLGVGWGGGRKIDAGATYPQRLVRKAVRQAPLGPPAKYAGPSSSE
jgi:hypothetical protein